MPSIADTIRDAVEQADPEPAAPERAPEPAAPSPVPVETEPAQAPDDDGFVRLLSLEPTDAASAQARTEGISARINRELDSLESGKACCADGLHFDRVAVMQRAGDLFTQRPVRSGADVAAIFRDAWKQWHAETFDTGSVKAAKTITEGADAHAEVQRRRDQYRVDRGYTKTNEPGQGRSTRRDFEAALERVLDREWV